MNVVNEITRSFEGGMRVILRLRGVNDIVRFQRDIGVVIRFCALCRETYFTMLDILDSIDFLNGRGVSEESMRLLRKQYRDRVERCMVRVYACKEMVFDVLSDCLGLDTSGAYRLFNEINEMIETLKLRVLTTV